MAYCLSPSSNAYRPISPSLKCSFHPRLLIRAQRFRDSEGQRSSRDMVDTNLGILRRRMDEAKAKEMLNRCWGSQLGWGYSDSITTAKSSGTIPQMARGSSSAKMSEGFELACLVFGNIGLTFMGGSLLLCLTSVFINFCLNRCASSHFQILWNVENCLDETKQNKPQPPGSLTFR